MNNLRKVLNLSFILFAFIAILSSCGKEDTLTETNRDNITSSNTNFANLRNAQTNGNPSDTTYDCFQLVFPITINIPGAGSEVANDEEELWTIIDDYFEENGDDITEFPTLEFPVNVILEDGSTQTVNDEETLCELFEECIGDLEDEWDDEWDGEYEEECFEFVYPLEIELEDGTVVAIESEEDWETVFDDSGTYAYFNLVFPLDVVLEDGSTQTVNDENELGVLYEDCLGDIGGDCDSTDIEELCFEFVFPLNIGLPDGVTVSVNDEEELFETIEAYYEQNPTSDEEPVLVYPVDVVLEDGSSQTLNNDEDLEDLLEECYGDGFWLVNPSPMTGMARMSTN